MAFGAHVKHHSRNPAMLIAARVGQPVQPPVCRKRLVRDSDKKIPRTDHATTATGRHFGTRARSTLTLSYCSGFLTVSITAWRGFTMPSAATAGMPPSGSYGRLLLIRQGIFLEQIPDLIGTASISSKLQSSTLKLQSTVNNEREENFHRADVC